MCYQNQETPLHRATANGHAALCEMILQLTGIDKNAIDKVRLIASPLVDI
jgi:hypothetical protein